MLLEIGVQKVKHVRNFPESMDCVLSIQRCDLHVLLLLLNEKKESHRTQIS